MTENYKLRDHLKPDDRVERRAFLSSFAGGMGLILAHGEWSKVQAGFLESSITPSDSLILLTDLLFDLNNEAVSDAARDLFSTTQKCADTLQLLYDKVRLLETKLNGSPKQAKVVQIRKLVDVNRMNSHLLRKSLMRSDGTSRMLVALETINEQVGYTATNLLTNQTGLTQEVRAIIEEIIKLVNDFSSVPGATVEAEKTFRRKLDSIRTQIKAVKSLIFKASVAALAGNKEEASKAIVDAIVGVRELVNRPRVQSGPAYQLVENLEGTRIWINNPAAVNIGVASDADKHHPDNTSRTSGKAEALITPLVGIGDLLEGQCQPNTRWRRYTCMVAAAPAWARHPLDGNARLPLIRGALQNFQCATDEARNTLANALAGV